MMPTVQPDSVEPNRADATSAVYKGQGSDPYFYFITPGGNVYAQKLGEPMKRATGAPRAAIMAQLESGILTPVEKKVEKLDPPKTLEPAESYKDAMASLPRPPESFDPTEGYEDAMASLPKPEVEAEGKPKPKPEPRPTRDPVVRATRAFFAFAPTAAAAANQARLGVQGATRGAASAMVPESTKTGMTRAGENFSSLVDSAYDRVTGSKR